MRHNIQILWRYFMTELKNDKGLTKLGRLSVLRIEGLDACEFLQGQVTLDAKRIDATPRLSGYCDAKGRVLASLILFKKDASFFAILSSDLAEKITKRLRLYSLRRKVTIDLAPELTVYGAFDSVDDEADAIALSLPFASLVIKEGEVKSAFEEDIWWEKALLAKFPWVFAKTEGLFIPQSINFDAWDAITYGKGCYVGQEVISRIHSLGTPSRISVLFKGFPEDFNAGLVLYDSCKNAVATLVYGVAGYGLVECSVKDIPAKLFTENGTELTKVD